MDVGYPGIRCKKIKYVLVFFCFSALMGCHKEKGITHVSVTYVDQKPIGISLKAEQIQGLQLYIEGETQTPVLGSWTSKANKHWFTSVVPLSPGQSYKIIRNTSPIHTFTVGKNPDVAPPELMALYPGGDTVPQNLLKMYVLFSRPMQKVGRALDFISVTDHTDEKDVQLFLDLENELWNHDHTRLTLWLDPGRIKTGLIPNKEQGLPLIQGHSYTLTISGIWKASDGTPLKQTYRKKLVVRERDDEVPTMTDWNLEAPKAHTADPLHIYFGESMDAVLAQETIGIWDERGNLINGRFELMERQEGISFYPLTNWAKGNYKIKSEDKLEDLAGNNLAHLFDIDLKTSLEKAPQV
ncbi:MAG: hypothetical protein AAFO99_14825, partial [Bacteroidota bacterium]